MLNRFNHVLQNKINIFFGVTIYLNFLPKNCRLLVILSNFVELIVSNDQQIIYRQVQMKNQPVKYDKNIPSKPKRPEQYIT